MSKVTPRAFEMDELWPRCEDYRYRMYFIVGNRRDCPIAAPDLGGIGLALQCMVEEDGLAGRKISDRGRFGILDVMPGGIPSPRGEWVILPYDRTPA